MRDAGKRFWLAGAVLIGAAGAAFLGLGGSGSGGRLVLSIPARQAPPSEAAALDLIAAAFPEGSQALRHPEPYFGRLRAELPGQFAEEAVVRSYKANVRIRPLGAAASRREEPARGWTLYRNAFEFCDLAYRTSPERVEEYLVVRKAGSGAASWSWSLRVAEYPVPLRPWLSKDGSITFRDEKRIARLHIEAPLGRDAQGVELRHGERLRYELAQESGERYRLTLHADLAGLAAPVVIDPTWRAAPRIIDGTNVAASEFPTVGEIGQGGSVFCTGTLIAANAVLTAGHCYTDDNGNLTVSQTGAEFTLGGTTYSSSQVIVNPTYRGFQGETEGQIDAIVVILNTSVSGVTPTPLFRSTPTVDTTLTLAGYGEQGTGKNGGNGTFPSSGTINFGTTPIDIVTDTFIKWNFEQSTPAESNTAPGDSGGPAFIDVGGTLQIAGITSGGVRSDAGFGDRSYDVRVDAIAGWIDSVAGTGSGNGSPFFTSSPSASNSTPNPNEQVDFSTAVSDPNDDPVTITWDFADGVQASGPNVSHTFTAAGIYQVTVTATDGNGGSVRGSLEITVFEAGMTLDKATLNLRLSGSGFDRASLGLILTFTREVDLANATLAINIGGFSTTVTLDERERTVSGDPRIRFRIPGHRAGESVPAGSEAFVTVHLDDDLVGGGLVLGGISNLNADTERGGEEATLSVTLAVGDQSFGAVDVPGFYKAQEDRNGRFKL